MRLNRVIPLPSAALLLLSPIALLAQTTEEDSGFVIRSNTRLVQVEVIVRDKKGLPVGGLTPQDFLIQEDSKPQTIHFFQGHSGVQVTPHDLPPGMVSNRPDASGPRRGITVILVDSLNSRWQSKALARQGLLRFLKTARPDDSIALYTLGSTFRVLHDFTSDTASLLSRLDLLGDDFPIPNPEANIAVEDLIPAAAAMVRLSEGKYHEMELVQRVEKTVGVLEGIARHLGSTPGRKSLIWISEGFPLQVGFNSDIGTSSTDQHRVTTGEQRLYNREFQQMRRALSDANVAVFPINPQGLTSLARFDPAPTSMNRLRNESASNAMMEQLASYTGGRAFVRENDLLAAIRQTVDHARMSYTIAYYPTNSAFDGRHRNISVKMNRSGLTADHRKGYEALDAQALSALDPETEMRTAARDPLDSGLVGIDGSIIRQGSMAKALLRINATDLLWISGSQNRLGGSIGIFQFDAEGRALKSFVDTVDANLDLQRATLMEQHGMSYSREFTLEPGATRIRAVVRATKTGAVGTLALPLPKDVEGNSLPTPK